MKTGIFIAVVVLFHLSPAITYSQPGATAEEAGSLQRLPGNIFSGIDRPSAFSAGFEIRTKGSSNLLTTTLPGRIDVLREKRRIEVDFGAMLTNGSPELSSDRFLRNGGMRVVFVLRPDKHVYWEKWSYRDTYMERPMKDSDASHSESQHKVEVTRLGEEVVDGHPCVKSKVVETDTEGRKHESIVWSATDLKNFPLKTENSTCVMLFKDVKLEAPDDALFDPPGKLKANMLTLLFDLAKLIHEMKRDAAATNSW